MYQFLQKEGLPDEMCDAFLLQAKQERSALIRKRSLLKFIAGLVGAIVCGAILVYLGAFQEDPLTSTSRHFSRFIIGLWTGTSVSGLFALNHGWALFTGKTIGSAMDD
ncbi:hypothetical protein N9B73_04630 [Verrucomicrobiales bacterium]|nr:hypothetical protein [Verrucomicrobiales bacterium]